MENIELTVIICSSTLLIGVMLLVSVLWYLGMKKRELISQVK